MWLQSMCNCCDATHLTACMRGLSGMVYQLACDWRPPVESLAEGPNPARKGLADRRSLVLCG
jgi:hypothetical protein